MHANAKKPGTPEVRAVVVERAPEPFAPLEPLVAHLLARDWTVTVLAHPDSIGSMAALVHEHGKRLVVRNNTTKQLFTSLCRERVDYLFHNARDFSRSTLAARTCYLIGLYGVNRKARNIPRIQVDRQLWTLAAANDGAPRRGPLDTAWRRLIRRAHAVSVPSDVMRRRCLELDLTSRPLVVPPVALFEAAGARIEQAPASRLGIVVHGDDASSSADFDWIDLLLAEWRNVLHFTVLAPASHNAARDASRRLAANGFEAAFADTNTGNSSQLIDGADVLLAPVSRAGSESRERVPGAATRAHLAAIRHGKALLVPDWALIDEEFTGNLVRYSDNSGLIQQIANFVQHPARLAEVQQRAASNAASFVPAHMTMVDAIARVPASQHASHRPAVRLPATAKAKGTHVRTASPRLVVQMNHGGAGFFVYPQFVMNGILYSEQMKDFVDFPCVDFGPKTLDGKANHFYDVRYGDVFFNYFRVRDSVVVDEDAERFYPGANFWWDLHNDRIQGVKSVQAYPHGLHDHMKALNGQPYNDTLHAWFGERRQTAHRILEQYFEVKHDIRRDLDEKWRSIFNENDYVVGVQIRGTDKKAHLGGPKITPEEYYPYVDKLIAERDAKLFLATDDPSYFDTFVARYGTRVGFLPGIMRSEANIFLDKREKNNFKKGLDVLRDAMCLSKCNFLLKCASAVSEWAIYFNIALHDNSLNLQYDCSRFLAGPLGAKDDLRLFHAGENALAKKTGHVSNL